MIVLISYRRRLIPVITSITEARSYIIRPHDYAGIAKADRAVIDSVPADRERWLSVCFRAQEAFGLALDAIVHYLLAVGCVGTCQ